MKSLPTRFSQKIDFTQSCWQWTAYLDKSGYGQFRDGKKQVKAHRYSWIISYGEIPDGLCVLHKCDNPRCVNPAHLFLGTIQDNNLDKTIKGRSAKHEGNGRAELSELDVEQIRFTYRRNSNGWFSQKGLSWIYGVTQVQIGRIVNGKNWI